MLPLTNIVSVCNSLYFNRHDIDFCEGNIYPVVCKYLYAKDRGLGFGGKLNVKFMLRNQMLLTSHPKNQIGF